MSRGVQRARVDGNHAEIVKALRQAGIGATSTASVGNGFPDIVASFRTVTVLLEVKDGDKPPSKQALTADEKRFHDNWPGEIHIVNSSEAAVLAVLGEAKRLGRL